MAEITCPTATHTPDGTPHTIIGCGSTNVERDPSEHNLYDCLDCGICFTPEPNPPSQRTIEQAVADIQAWRDAHAHITSTRAAEPDPLEDLDNRDYEQIVADRADARAVATWGTTSLVGGYAGGAA